MNIGFLAERMFRGFGVDRVLAQLAIWWTKRHNVEIWSVFTDGSYDQKVPIKIFPVGLNWFTPWYEFTAWRRKWILPKKDLWVITHPLAVLCRWVTPCIFYDFGVSPPWGMGGRNLFNYEYQILSTYYGHLRGAGKIVTGSHFLLRRLPPALGKNAEVIPPGCDHYPIPDEKVVQEYKNSISPEGLPLVFYAGRFQHSAQPYKGVKVLLQVYQGLRNVCVLVIAGYGEEKEAERLRAQGVKVFRQVSDEEMGILFSACDIYATASRWEGVDLPALEAQFFGKPVVAFHLAAHPEFIRHNQTGLLVHSNTEFRDSLLALLLNANRRKEIGQKAKEWALNFTWQKCFSSWDDVVSQNYPFG